MDPVAVDPGPGAGGRLGEEGGVRDDPAVGEVGDAGLEGDQGVLAVGTLDLEQGPTCDDRRAAVNRLRAAGDARALTALRRLRTRYACVTKDVDAAIAQLETPR